MQAMVFGRCVVGCWHIMLNQSWLAGDPDENTSGYSNHTWQQLSAAGAQVGISRAAFANCCN
jgi:hypothetical protein